MFCLLMEFLKLTVARHFTMTFLNTYAVVGLLVLLTRLGLAQQIAVDGKTYMDTTSSRNPACVDAAVARYYQVAGKYPRSSDTLLREAQAFLRQQGQVYTGSGHITHHFPLYCGLPGAPRAAHPGAANGRYLPAFCLPTRFGGRPVCLLANPCRVAGWPSGTPSTLYYVFKLQNAGWQSGGCYSLAVY